ncbi:MAG: LutC/YkgG family protein [Janthinobacterium lividum]
MSDARSAILDTVRRELRRDPDLSAAQLDEAPEAAYARIPRDYLRVGALPHEEMMELFLDRLRDYDAEILFTDHAGIASAVAQALQEAGEKLLLVPAEVSEQWLPADGIRILRDHSLSVPELDEARCVLTGCTVAIAMSGTVLLQHGSEQGRRAATLLPDHHICVIRKDQVVETIAEALPRLTEYKSAPITTIAGPSATSDIEMTRIRGVHGPRRFTAIIV